MKQVLSFHPKLRLDELAKRLGQFEALCGALIAIGNQDGVTVGEYDDASEGDGRIALRMGAPGTTPSGQVIASGTVFIGHQPQLVTAYREVAA